MKPRLIFSALASVVLAAAVSARADFPFVAETAKEFSVLADCDGDSQPDLVIVDKASGLYRIGYATSAINYDWPGSWPSGAENVTGFSVVRTPSCFWLGFTAPAANRVFGIGATNRTAAITPKCVYPAAIGPTQIAGIDIGSATNNPAIDDLFVSSEWNGTFPYAADLVRLDGPSGPTELESDFLPAALAAVKRVDLKATPSATGIAAYEPAASRMRLFDTATGTLVNHANTTGLGGGTNYVTGFFGGANITTFLWYRPGQFNFMVWRVIEPSLGNFAFAPGPNFTLGMSIEQLAVIGGATPQLLAIVNGGDSALVFNFDGTNFPAQTQTLTPPTGEKFTIATSGVGGRLALNSGVNGISAHATSYLKSGSNWVAQVTMELPALNHGGTFANVFLFEQEPFVEPQARLVARLNAADWSTNATVAAGKVSARAQTLGNSVQGLRGSNLRDLGDAPGSAHYSLVNQYRPAISLHSRQAARGEEEVTANITPAAGRYLQGVQFTLTAAPAGATLYWRQFAAAPWSAYAAPVSIFQNVTVQFYAELDGKKSAVGSAAYEFDVPPGQLDSDGDGVPDFVEIAKGLDPLRSGRDSDGDGYTDFEEILAGTSPTSDASHPGSHLQLEPTFDLRVTPYGLHPVDALYLHALPDVAVAVHDLAGALRGQGNVINFIEGGLTVTAAELRQLTRVNDDRLFAMASANTFDLPGLPLMNGFGRELLGLREMPVLDALAVDYDYNAAIGQAANVSNWLAAAQSAAATPALHMLEDLNYRDTLAALLVELKLEQVLHARGWDATNVLSLFPFRPNDAGRQSLALADFAAIERPATNGEPAWSLGVLMAVARARSESPFGYDQTQLAALAAELYRISAASTNVFPPPPDALREFLRTGGLPTNYLAATTLTALQQTAASNGVAQILDTMQPRHGTNLSLFVTANSFNTSGCVVLQTSLGTPFNLALAGGLPFVFPQSFDLPVGAVVQVFGYDDLPAGDCAGQQIEVVTATLTTLPLPSSSDANGDLLPDDWVSAFLGGAGDPFGDADGDGFSNLQELWDHTDPMDASAHGVTVVTLAAPVLDIAPPAGGGTPTSLTWTFPAAYADYFNFAVLAADDVDGSFALVGAPVTSPLAGHFSITLPPSSSSAQFYRLVLYLK